LNYGLNADPDPAFRSYGDPDPASQMNQYRYRTELTHSLARVIQMLEVFLRNLGSRLAERTLEPTRDLKEKQENAEKFKYKHDI
jgi:hypothetical protein